MAEEEEEVEVENTELEIKIESIGKEFDALRKPVELSKALWASELAKVDGFAESAAGPLKLAGDTSIDAPTQVAALLGLSLVSVKARARHEVALANLAEVDRALHVLALDQSREVEKARLALSPSEDE
ncbi:hypothetical protein KFE25_001492 [Diacronema lutheri]|uniref:Uncharacterized protein n=2 Tax=Diacronema lutheri TaxID=2081491 RepID=A0A8J5X0K2_DIALT|nr:hypothetical protein KFE25_001492 [Diacronema lutheri]